MTSSLSQAVVSVATFGVYEVSTNTVGEYVNRIPNTTFTVPSTPNGKVLCRVYCNEMVYGAQAQPPSSSQQIASFSIAIGPRNATSPATSVQHNELDGSSYPIKAIFYNLLGAFITDYNITFEAVLNSGDTVCLYHKMGALSAYPVYHKTGAGTIVLEQMRDLTLTN